MDHVLNSLHKRLNSFRTESYGDITYDDFSFNLDLHPCKSNGSKIRWKLGLEPGRLEVIERHVQISF